MTEQKFNGNVAVYGCGRVGKDTLYNLSVNKIGLYHYSYTTSTGEYDEQYGNQYVDIVCATRLREKAEVKSVSENVTCLIVTLTGDELRKHLDLLISLNVPLLFCGVDIDDFSAGESVLAKHKPVYISNIICDNDYHDKVIEVLEFLKLQKPGAYFKTDN